MHKIAKQSIVLFIIAALVVSTAGTAARAQDSYKETERSGEKMTADILLLRPAGLLATAGGALIFLISVPLIVIVLVAPLFLKQQVSLYCQP